jgi:hypothetical protein
MRLGARHVNSAKKKNKGKNTKNVLLCPLLSQIKFKRCGQRRARTHKKPKISFFLNKENDGASSFTLSVSGVNQWSCNGSRAVI